MALIHNYITCVNMSSVVASAITLVISIMIMKKLKKKKVKPEKKSANLIYQNCGVHAENTERDSPPFHEYVGILRDRCILLYINAFYFLILVLCIDVCICKCMIMYMYICVPIVMHLK